MRLPQGTGGRRVKASLIVPCWNSARTLPRFFACVQAQTLSDFEAIFIDDGSTDETPVLLADFARAAHPFCVRIVTQANRGVSAARNAGLDLARGTFVFFADPDDLVHAEMLAKGVAAMERDGADYCVFPYTERLEDETASHLVPLKGACRLASNEAIRDQYLTRFFGYSFKQVKAWYAGTPLFAHRVQGGVCWCVYRRALLEAHHIRFDSRIALYEDAMFNSAYLLYATRMTCLDEPLYDYLHERSGAIARLRRNGRELANKLELLRVRQELDAVSGYQLTPLYAASCVFSVLEMLRIVLTGRAPFWTGLRQVRAYLAEPVVRRAIREFPLCLRHPVLALGVLVLRVVAPVRRVEPNAAAVRSMG